MELVSNNGANLGNLFYLVRVLIYRKGKDGKKKGFDPRLLSSRHPYLTITVGGVLICPFDILDGELCETAEHVHATPSAEVKDGGKYRCH